MRTSRGLVTAVAIAVSLAACSGGNAPHVSPSATPPAATAGPAAPTTAAGTTVTATLSEYSITLSQTSFTPGSYTFVATESGQRPHALAIKGPAVDQATTTIQPGGAAQQLTVTLQTGSYELWCPVGNHKAQGMALTITVA